METAKKAKTQQLAILGLAAVFGVVMFNSLRTMGVLGGKRAAAPASRAAAASALAEVEVAPSSPKAPAVAGTAAKPVEGPLYTAQDLRDPLQDLLPRPEPPEAPMAPTPQVVQAVPEVPMPALLVIGLWWGGPTPQALINGKVCRIGDQIDGVTIKDIGRAGVTVEFAGRTVHLETARRDEVPGGPRMMESSWR